MPDPKKQPCPHNAFVGCMYPSQCDRCGWNPVVEKKRQKKAIREMKLRYQDMKPCPWCGSESFFVDQDENGWYVECNGCLSQGPRAETQEKAEKVWNRRANHG